MIDWGLVAAYVVPLIAAMLGASGWVSFMSRQREKRIQALIDGALAGFRASQELLAQRITQVEASLALQAAHLDRQDGQLMTAVQAVARIEGRLAGPLTLAQQG